MEPIQNRIASEVRGELAKQKMSQQTLAEKTGLSAQSISRKIGMGTRNLTMSDFWRISEALNLSPSKLLARAEQGLANPTPNRTEAA